MDATKISVLAPCSQWISLECLDVQMRILNTNVTIGDGVLFFLQASVLFSTENAKLWPVLANYYTYNCYFLGKFALFSILFTGLKSALVYQN